MARERSADVLRAVPLPAPTEAWCYWQNTPGQWLNQWREPCADDELLDALRRLPGDVYKVEATAQFLALYWGERGDSADLGRIAEFLRQRA